MTIAVLGLGGAGGNMANEAAELGMTAGAVNFSQRDLNSAEAVRYKLKVPGSEGVGHDRALAIELMQEHYEMVTEFIKDCFGSPSCQVIAVPFATGGGSGAGMAPILMDLLQAILPDKAFVAVPILPDASEAVVSQSNTSETMAELLKLNLCILPVDNAKVTPTQGKGHIYEETNKRMASHLFDLVSYTERHSRTGNFDRTDLCNLFRQRGLACISEVNVTQLPKANVTPSGIAKSIQESWDSSIFAPIEYSHVARAALIFDGQESLMGNLNPRLIFEAFKNGAPLDLFEGYYHDDTGRIITVLTGLPFCKSRFELIDGLIENASNHAELRSASEADSAPVYVPKVPTALLRQKTAQAGVSGGSLADRLARYSRDRR